KPHTPFQWCAMDTREQVRIKQGWLREEARAARIKLRMHGSDGSWLEGVLARGDRRLADVIEGAWRRGARFDSWEEQLKTQAWADAFEEAGVDPSIFLRTLPLSARLPWDHIDVGLEDGFLAREYKKALANRLSPPCGKAAGMHVHHTNVADAERDPRRLVCYDCGIACDLGAMREGRIAFLKQLGADGPPPAREEAPQETPAKGRRAPPPPLVQGRPVRVRIAFAKLGRAAYRGHLDLVKVLPRIFRRAGLPLYYSAGFHPKPEMTFAPALSLGIASLDEYVDVKLDGDVPFDLSDLPARLNAVSELGLEFTDAIVLGDADRRITRVVDEAVYVAGVPELSLRELGLDLEGLCARVAERRTGPLVVRRDIDGIGKKVDVKQYLLGVEVGAGAEVLERAGIAGRLVPMRIRLRITGGGTAKPSEALEALLGADVPARFVREALLAHQDGERISPREVARLRSAPRTAELAAE
ncbi:MAG TPA: TIGR03936 family radical SAM-associated protein, partial [Sandaracinaceae bacterium]